MNKKAAKPKIAKAGTLICIDSGSYSAYSVTGFFVALRDFDPMAELEEHMTANPGQKEPYRFDGHSYLAALLAKGLLVEIDYSNLYLGDYAGADEVAFHPANDK